MQKNRRCGKLHVLPRREPTIPYLMLCTLKKGHKGCCYDELSHRFQIPLSKMTDIQFEEVLMREIRSVVRQFMNDKPDVLKELIKRITPYP